VWNLFKVNSSLDKIKPKKKFYFTNQTSDRKHAREIELKIEQATGLELENPFYDGAAKEVKQLDATGKSDLSPDEIVGADLRKIRERDGLVALITHVQNIGSMMEIAICAMCWGKPVYTITTLPWVASHPWIKHFSTQVFKTHYEFIKYAKENLI